MLAVMHTDKERACPIEVSGKCEQQASMLKIAKAEVMITVETCQWQGKE